MPDTQPTLSRKGALALLGLAGAAIAVNIALLAAFDLLFPVAVSLFPGLLLVGVVGLVKPDLANFLLVDVGLMKGDKRAFPVATRLTGGAIFVTGCVAGLLIAVTLIDR
jgi:hypothetical protein